MEGVSKEGVAGEALVGVADVEALLAENSEGIARLIQ